MCVRAGNQKKNLILKNKKGRRSHLLPVVLKKIYILHSGSGIMVLEYTAAISFRWIIEQVNVK